MKILAAIALAFYLAHATDLMLHHPPEVLLWSCDVAALLVPLALFARRPLLNAAGGIVLLAGLPLWIIDITTAGEFRPTSPLIHLGTTAVAILAMRRIGVPRGSGVVAVLVMAGATAAARVFGSLAENVNLAHTRPRGWETTFSSHAVYMAMLGLTMTAVMLALEVGLRRALRLGAGAPRSG